MASASLLLVDWKYTHSSFPHCRHSTSLVFGKVGSDVTSVMIADFSLRECCTSCL